MATRPNRQLQSVQQNPSKMPRLQNRHSLRRPNHHWRGRLVRFAAPASVQRAGRHRCASAVQRRTTGWHPPHADRIRRQTRAKAAKRVRRIDSTWQQLRASAHRGWPREERTDRRLDHPSNLLQETASDQKWVAEPRPEPAAKAIAPLPPLAALPRTALWRCAMTLKRPGFRFVWDREQPFRFPSSACVAPAGSVPHAFHATPIHKKQTVQPVSDLYRKYLKSGHLCL